MQTYTFVPTHAIDGAFLFMAHEEERSTEHRLQARAQAIAAAVRQARERRGLSVRGLSKAAGISPSSLSRIENPDSTGSPKVETMETLAGALDCPLCELLGEPVVIEYQGLGDWPVALQEVLAERGGFVTTTERAFIEQRLETLRSFAPFIKTTRVTPDGVSTPFQVEDDPGQWRSQLQKFRDSSRWRIIESLVEDGWRLNRDVLAGLASIMRGTVGLDDAVAEEEADQ